MKYVVYCDESRHDGPQNHRYMAIGGLWVNSAHKDAVTRQFRDLKRALGLNAETKWNKVSASRLEDYRKLCDFFFDAAELNYRVIVVDQSKVDVQRFHEGDWELGFYKFYYQMLKAWVTPSNEYLILLDFKQNKDKDRYSDLRRILRRRATAAKAKILDLSIIDSSQSPLAQLCDILTGAVAASCCADVQSAKATLAAHIASRAGFPNLGSLSYSPAFAKFNIFRINLS